MSESTHKVCYGKMFPDALHFGSDQPIRGKAFWFEMDTAGGVTRSDRQVGVDIEEWDDCRNCPEFEHCYRLCVGKLALEAVIADK